MVAEHLIDRAAFGDHPLGRPVLGPEEHLRTFTREAIVEFRTRQWAGARGGAFLVGNLDSLPDDAELADAFCRFPSISANGGFEPAPAFSPQTLVEERDSNQSHLRMSYRPDVDATDVRRRARADRLLHAAGRLDGLAPVRRDPRAARPRLLRLLGRPRLRRRADPAALRRPGVGKCVEAYTRMREIVDELRADGPNEEEFERAKAYAAGRRVLAFENTNAVARHAASQTVVFGQDIHPDAAIKALQTTFDDVAEVARGISEDLSVACVGPHSANEFA